MADSLVMDNSRPKREASVMHNLRSLRMGSNGVANDNTRNLQSSSTEGILNEARQAAKVDSRLNMYMAGAKAHKAGAKAKTEGKNIREGAMKQGGRLLNRMGTMRGVKDKKEKSMAVEAFQQATGGVLCQAWISLIPSWGLSLIWINIHAFMRWIFPQFFCKLGSEWIPKSIRRGNEMVGIMAFYLEAMTLALIDVLILFLIFCLGVLTVMIAGFWHRVAFWIAGKLIYVWHFVV